MRVSRLAGVVFICLSVIALQIRSASFSNQADIVVFSYDRPLQLYAFLESVDKYMTGIGQLIVICRISNQEFKKGYDIVKADFPRVIFYEQGAVPTRDFKQLTLKASFESPSSYILFAVDDIVIKDTVDVARCINALEQYGAYAFYLRLGKNLNYCYPDNRYQPVPPLTQEDADIYSWRFSESILDWRYPHTVDMTLYRKKDIEGDFKTLSYPNPNRLEGAWSCRIRNVLQRKGLCFAQSKIVNFPLNRVQHDTPNRAMNMSAQELLVQFNAGKKMDISLVYNIDNKSAHTEYVPTFVLRS